MAAEDVAAGSQCSWQNRVAGWASPHLEVWESVPVASRVSHSAHAGSKQVLPVT